MFDMAGTLSPQRRITKWEALGSSAGGAQYGLDRRQVFFEKWVQ
jgi:hypothetical protein